MLDFDVINSKRHGTDWALNCGVHFYSAKKDIWHINLFVNIQKARTCALVIALCWIVMMKEKRLSLITVPRDLNTMAD